MSIAAFSDIFLDTVGVHPRKYGMVAQRIAQEYRLDEQKARRAMKMAVGMIYLAVPPLYPETGDVLEMARDVELRTVFVTHSPRGRIRRMMTVWGLWGWVPV